jgi:hypothetical protein
MKEQLELIARTNSRPGDNFSGSPLADTWFVNLRILKARHSLSYFVTDARHRPVSA